MYKLKRFKNFLNEEWYYDDVDDDQLEAYLSKMNPIDRIWYIDNYQKDKSFYPKRKDIIEHLIKMGNKGETTLSWKLKSFKERRLINTNDIYKIFQGLESSKQILLYNIYSYRNETIARNILLKLVDDSQELRDFLGDVKVSQIRNNEPMEPRTYPHGYTTFKILELIDDSPNGRRRKDIIKMIHELKYGSTLNFYDNIAHRGHWSSFFNHSRYIEKSGVAGDRSNWILSDLGEERLKFYRRKFDYRPHYRSRAREIIY